MVIGIIGAGKVGTTLGKYLMKRDVAISGFYKMCIRDSVYTTDVVVEEQEFAESKAAAANNGGGYQQAAPSRPEPTQAAGDGFMNIPDAIDEELPFKN